MDCLKLECETLGWWQFPRPNIARLILSKLITKIMFLIPVWNFLAVYHLANHLAPTKFHNHLATMPAYTLTQYFFMAKWRQKTRKKCPFKRNCFEKLFSPVDFGVTATNRLPVAKKIVFCSFTDILSRSDLALLNLTIKVSLFVVVVVLRFMSLYYCCALLFFLIRNSRDDHACRPLWCLHYYHTIHTIIWIT